MRDFLDWWSKELAGFIKSLSDGANRNASTPLGLRDGSEIGTPPIDAEQLGFPRPLKFFRDESVVLEGPFLKLPSAGRQLPYSRSLAVTSAMLKEKTPFAVQDVYIFPRFATGAGSYFYVIKKTTIEPLLTQPRPPGTKVRRLGIRDGDEIYWLPSRALENLHPVFHHIRQWRNGLLAAFAILLVTGGATYAHAFFKYSAAEQELAEAIEAKRSEALQVRKLLDRQQRSIAAVEAARKGKSQAVPVVRVWEELTRVLPDDAWLTDVTIDGDTMTITGFAAQSAASLIATLDGSDLFSEPSFISPVLRIPGQSGERFEIRLRVGVA
ncbi:PilN domain-containing protein [Neorhizobium sp. DT-125]|uniref:PilN domain-containing protein n=1 Tax=Neorhizobium sp. DT-125 TaxID=3396163 RepID=UPI003F1D9CF1